MSSFQTKDKARSVVDRERPVNDKRELARRWVVRLTFIIYGLLIFEGVLRKYIFPQYGRYLFFIRDPLVLCLYVYAITHKLRPKQSYILFVGGALALISVPLLFIQRSNSVNFDLVLAAYGWRNYFFYLPLAFFVAPYVRPQDVQRLMRWTLVVAIPISVLVFAQVQSSPTAPINQGFGTSDEEIFYVAGVSETMVRTYGTFTSGPGQAAFIGTSFAMLLAAWAVPRAKRFVNYAILLPATGAVLACIALSGSRGVMVASGLILCGATLAALVQTGKKLNLRMLLVPALIAGLAVIAAPVAFPTAVEAFLSRWQDAGLAETDLYGSGGIFGRAVYDLTDFTFLLDDTPGLPGYQLGIGGNAANVLGAQAQMVPLSSDAQIAAAESDWGRNILELGPLLGSAFIGFRIAFILWLGAGAIHKTRSSSDPLPIILFSFTGVLMFNGQVTGHGTLNGYGWLFSGIQMAVNQIPRKHSSAATNRRSSASAPFIAEAVPR